MATLAVIAATEDTLYGSGQSISVSGIVSTNATGGNLLCAYGISPLARISSSYASGVIAVHNSSLGPCRNALSLMDNERAGKFYGPEMFSHQFLP